MNKLDLQFDYSTANGVYYEPCTICMHEFTHTKSYVINQIRLPGKCIILTSQFYTANYFIMINLNLCQSCLFFWSPLPSGAETGNQFVFFFLLWLNGMSLAIASFMFATFKRQNEFFVEVFIERELTTKIHHV